MNKWMIHFIKDPIKVIVVFDWNVSQDDIDEYGEENTTGILCSDGHTFGQSNDYPELYVDAAAAAGIEGPAKYQARESIENRAWEIARKLTREMHRR